MVRWFLTDLKWKDQITCLKTSLIVGRNVFIQPHVSKSLSQGHVMRGKTWEGFYTKSLRPASNNNVWMELLPFVNNFLTYLPILQSFHYSRANLDKLCGVVVNWIAEWVFEPSMHNVRNMDWRSIQTLKLWTDKCERSLIEDSKWELQGRLNLLYERGT